MAPTTSAPPLEIRRIWREKREKFFILCVSKGAASDGILNVSFKTGCIQEFLQAFLGPLKYIAHLQEEKTFNIFEYFFSDFTRRQEFGKTPLSLVKTQNLHP